MSRVLTPEKREAILQMRRENPKVTYAEMAARASCSTATAWKVINFNKWLANRAGPKMADPSKPPKVDPFKYTSFVPDPAMLRGGRAHPLRRLSGAH